LGTNPNKVQALAWLSSGTVGRERCRAFKALRMISPFGVLVYHGASYVTVAHGVHHSFQISGLRQPETAEVVTRTVENKFTG
jgi:hypothetical protein